MAVHVYDIINAILLVLLACFHLVFNKTSIVTSGLDYSELKH